MSLGAASLSEAFVLSGTLASLHYPRGDPVLLPQRLLTLCLVLPKGSVFIFTPSLGKSRIAYLPLRSPLMPSTCCNQG